MTASMDQEAAGDADAIHSTVLAISVLPSSQPEPIHVDFKDQVREHRFEQDGIPSAPAVAMRHSDSLDLTIS